MTMASPTNTEELLEIVRKSGVVEEERLQAFLKTLQDSGTTITQPIPFAQRMIREGLITTFQAKQLLSGKWRRFKISGKYKLLELLGAGGMGAVYLCEHIHMKRLVALKVLPADKLKDPSAVERFYREGRASAALDHPNIVRAHDIDQDENLHFLVMEYVDGSSLQDIVAKNGPMDYTRAAHYVRQAAEGLHHAGEAGLVHRDIKPGNLLLDRTGTVKILDMGLARFFGAVKDSVTEKYDERCILGTADYLSPEQAVQSNVDIRADIYSLGATFYFLLTGRAPFEEGSVNQKLIWHQLKQPTPVTEFRQDVPAELIAVIDKMMAKSPDQRYQTPLEVVEALEPWTMALIDPPPEAEMPRLSPAIPSGPRTQSTNGMASRGPQSSGRVSGSRSGRITPLSGPRSGTSRPASGVRAKPASGGVAVKDSKILKSATVPVAADPGVKSGTYARSRRLKPRGLPKAGLPPWAIAAATGAAVVLVGALALWGAHAALSARTAKSTTATAPTGASTKPPPALGPLFAGTPIPPEKAKEFMGQNVVVDMVVKKTGMNNAKTLLFLNSMADFRNAKSIAIVISIADLEQNFHTTDFEKFLREHEGKHILVSGAVSEFNDARFGKTTQIFVKTPEQIKVLD
jgi:eukaryotic-like serine/threonine-protein kinase